MKLLTLNTHSLVEPDYNRKLHEFVLAVAEMQPDIIALQEVNQTISEKPVEKLPTSYFPSGGDVVINRDNHAYRVAELLCEKGVEYHWTWLPIKRGYGIYNEGVALLSRSPIKGVETVLASGADNPLNWKTRKLLGITTEACPDEWYYSMHLGWWDDSDEPFALQWERSMKHLRRHDSVWLMGDFNSPAEVRGEGYDLISGSGYHDSYSLARVKDSGITVSAGIDGWQEKSVREMRIDQLWCSRCENISSSQVVFNGVNYPVVSDHCGVLVNCERGSV